MFNLHKPWPFLLIVGIDPSRKPGILLFKKDAFEFNCSVSFACGFIKELVPDFNRCDTRSSNRSIEIQQDAVSTLVKDADWPVIIRVVAIIAPAAGAPSILMGK